MSTDRDDKTDSVRSIVAIVVVAFVVLMGYGIGTLFGISL